VARAQPSNKLSLSTTTTAVNKHRSSRTRIRQKRIVVVYVCRGKQTIILSKTLYSVGSRALRSDGIAFKRLRKPDEKTRRRRDLFRISEPTEKQPNQYFGLTRISTRKFNTCRNIEY